MKEIKSQDHLDNMARQGTPKRTRTTYRAALCNSAGPLDFISADDLETLGRQLGKRLASGTWTLAEGDVIRIESGEVPA